MEEAACNAFIKLRDADRLRLKISKVEENNKIVPILNAS